MKISFADMAYLDELGNLPLPTQLRGLHFNWCDASSLPSPANLDIFEIWLPRLPHLVSLSLPAIDSGGLEHLQAYMKSSKLEWFSTDHIILGEGDYAQGVAPHVRNLLLKALCKVPSDPIPELTSKQP